MNPTAELEVIAIDHIAAMIYQTELNIKCMERKVMKLKPCSLKDVVILYVENQKNWLRKLMNGMKSIDMKETMQTDLQSQDLDNYAVICEFARQTHDTDAAANLMEHISQCPDIPDWAQRQIVSILNPLK